MSPRLEVLKIRENYDEKIRVAVANTNDDTLKHLWQNLGVDPSKPFAVIYEKNDSPSSDNIPEHIYQVDATNITAEFGKMVKEYFDEEEAKEIGEDIDETVDNVKDEL